jgi:hypothetical protein
MKSILQAHLEEYQAKLFEWGEADCYTLIREYLDKQFPGNKGLKVEYKTEKEAYRFNLKHDWFKELNKSFETQIVEANNAQNGDLLIVRDKFQGAHIIYNNQVYSMSELTNLSSLPLKTLGAVKLLRLIRSF